MGEERDGLSVNESWNLCVGLSGEREEERGRGEALGGCRDAGGEGKSLGWFREARVNRGNVDVWGAGS